MSVDVNVIFNHIWAIQEINSGENWTTICMPGCSEEYMLNIYTYFRYQNLGMVLICTDQSKETFDACHEYRITVLSELSRHEEYAGPGKPLLQEVVDKSTLAQYEIKDFKEI